ALWRQTMKRRNFFATLFAFAAMLVMFAVSGSTAQAQVGPGPGPCPTYWIKYNYVYPPAPAGQFTFQIQCADGRILSTTNELADGHYTYPADPTCIATAVIVTWPGPPAGSVTLPIPGGPVFVPTPWGPLKIESKFDSNGCLEIKVSY
ncbi:MAG: hypothetical protein ABI876_18905, partial [Bacteroidota bacterium]